MDSLLERFGSLLERAEITLERLFTAPGDVQASSTPPPLAGIDNGCADGGSEPFGCYSPRKVTSPVGELFHELAGMMSGSSSDERRGCHLNREEIMQEIHVELPRTVTGEVISRQDLLDGVSCERGHVDMEEEAARDYGEMQQMSSSLVDLGEQVVVLNDEEVCIDDPGAGAIPLTDQGVAGQRFDKDVPMPAQAGFGEQGLEMDAPLCPLAGFLARVVAPIEVSVLGTPATTLFHEKEVEAASVRRSDRFAKLHPEGANMEQLAMEAVARRLGSQPEEDNNSERLRQDYLALWGDKALTDQAMAAIDDLVLYVKNPKKKVSGTGMTRQRLPKIA